MKISNEVLDSHDNQLDCSLSFEEDGEVIGAIDYTIYNGEIHIAYIAVRPEWRGKGIGQKMIKELIRNNIRKPIHWGTMTPDGAALKKKLEKAGFKRFFAESCLIPFRIFSQL